MDVHAPRLHRAAAGLRGARRVGPRVGPEPALRPGLERLGARLRVDQDPRLRAAGLDLPDDGDRRRRGAPEVRLHPRRPGDGCASARRLRDGDRAVRRIARRRAEHQGDHSVPEGVERLRPAHRRPDGTAGRAARRARNLGPRAEGLTASGESADAPAILFALMATERGQQASLTPLPSVEELPTLQGGGYDPERVKEAFEAFRRHTTQLQVQLRVLQAAARSGQVEPTGHAVRMDALHMIRAAADMADTIERDAQTASASQLRRTEEEVTRRQRELQERENEVERYRQESERQRAEMLNNARNEVRELQADAQSQTTAEIREAEARASRLLEQARHQATELTNAARAEVEQTLEWSRAQASAVMARAQEGAEQLLAAAGLGDEAIAGVVDKIVEAAQAATEASRGPAASSSGGEEASSPGAPSPLASAAPSLSVPAPVEPPVAAPDEEPDGSSSA